MDDEYETPICYYYDYSYDKFKDRGCNEIYECDTELIVCTDIARAFKLDLKNGHFATGYLDGRGYRWVWSF